MKNNSKNIRMPHSFNSLETFHRLRYRVEFDRHYFKKRGLTLTVTPEIAKQLVGYFAANYFLFPTEDHRRLLEDQMKQLKATIEHQEHLFEKEELRLLESAQNRRP